MNLQAPRKAERDDGGRGGSGGFIPMISAEDEKLHSPNRG